MGILQTSLWRLKKTPGGKVKTGHVLSTIAHRNSFLHIRVASFHLQTLWMLLSTCVKECWVEYGGILLHHGDWRLKIGKAGCNALCVCKKHGRRKPLPQSQDYASCSSEANCGCRILPAMLMISSWSWPAHRRTWSWSAQRAKIFQEPRILVHRRFWSHQRETFS